MLRGPKVVSPSRKIPSPAESHAERQVYKQLAMLLVVSQLVQYLLSSHRQHFTLLSSVVRSTRFNSFGDSISLMWFRLSITIRS